MPNYSQQYIARVIMHEALHAFMHANSIDFALQHDIILQYFTQMASSLEQMFPGIDSDIAKSLSLGGLQVSPYFESVKTELNLTSGFDAVQIGYSTGALGTRCN